VLAPHLLAGIGLPVQSGALSPKLIGVAAAVRTIALHVPPRLRLTIELATRRTSISRQRPAASPPISETTTVPRRAGYSHEIRAQTGTQAGEQEFQRSLNPRALTEKGVRCSPSVE
jgi:hypothetical protein